MGSCFRRGAFRGKWLNVTPVNQAPNIFVFKGHFLSLLPHCPPHHLFCLLQLLNLPLASKLLLETNNALLCQLCCCLLYLPFCLPGCDCSVPFLLLLFPLS